MRKSTRTHFLYPLRVRTQKLINKGEGDIGMVLVIGVVVFASVVFAATFSGMFGASKRRAPSSVQSTGDTGVNYPTVPGSMTPALMPSTQVSAQGVVVLPEQGLMFLQIDFTFPKETERNSDWGEVVVDTEELSDSTGRSSGYLNVFTDAGWVVDNLFVDAENSRQAMKYFSLGLEKPEDVTRLSAHVVFSKNPKSSFKDGPRSNFPVGTTKWNAQGAGQEDVTEIPAAPPPKETLR
jgi:hypothetical protein